MKKLVKRSDVMQETLEAYCSCSCSCYGTCSSEKEEVLCLILRSVMTAEQM